MRRRRQLSRVQTRRLDQIVPQVPEITREEIIKELATEFRRPDTSAARSTREADVMRRNRRRQIAEALQRHGVEKV